MRAMVGVGVLLLGCMPVKRYEPAPEAPEQPRSFKVGPQLVKLSEPREQVVGRLAQLALGLGLNVESVSLKDGAFRGQRVRLDGWATQALGSGGREVVRRFRITAIAGDGTATISPSVVRCIRRAAFEEACDDMPVELEEDELLILDKLMRVIMAPPSVPAGTGI